MNDINAVEEDDFDGPELEPPEGFVDLHPERGFANSDYLGYILKITGRQVRSLATAGVLPRKADGPFAGQWEIMPSIDRWVSYKTAPPSAKAERIAAAQVRLIDRRIARENLDLMEMSDALEVFDFMTASFMEAANLAEIEIAAISAEDDVPRVVKPVFRHTKEHLTEIFAEHRAALISGPKKKGRRDED